MTEKLPTPYLTPYLRAAQRYGSGFEALLWANADTQAARFDAIQRLCPLSGKSVLDVGCGRADLVDFLVARHVQFADYIGIEAVPALMQAAEKKAEQHANVTLIPADFVKEPQRMFVAADVVVFSGSLNTLEESDFFNVLRRAFDATADAVVFNFLSSPALAAAKYLVWHEPEDVLRFARTLSSSVSTLNDYLDGDFTVCLHREHDVSSNA